MTGQCETYVRLRPRSAERERQLDCPRSDMRGSSWLATAAAGRSPFAALLLVGRCETGPNLATVQFFPHRATGHQEKRSFRACCTSFPSYVRRYTFSTTNFSYFNSRIAVSVYARPSIAAFLREQFSVCAIATSCSRPAARSVNIARGFPTFRARSYSFQYVIA